LNTLHIIVDHRNVQSKYGAFGEKTYEETEEALLSHTLILHPLYIERKIIPTKAKRSVAFFYTRGLGGGG
jgi:hypothetical protein